MLGNCDICDKNLIGVDAKLIRICESCLKSGKENKDNIQFIVDIISEFKNLMKLENDTIITIFASQLEIIITKLDKFLLDHNAPYGIITK